MLVITTSFASSFFPYHSAKTQSVRKLALKIGQKPLLLYVVFITSLACSRLNFTRHKKYTAFCGVYVLSLFSSLLHVNVMRAALMSSQGTISCARGTLRLLYQQK